MAQQIINVGTLPNDGIGDPLRTAFTKINTNFNQLFSAGSNTLETFTIGNTPGQVLFEIASNAITQGTFQINSSDPITNNSQNISIAVAISNDGATAGSAQFGAITIGSPVATYTVDVNSGNLRILASPLTTSRLTHFIAFETSFIGVATPGPDIALDGYPANSVMTTETGFILAAE